ncbi:Uma2 family endonuclease [Coleofasciculus sp. G2-EDA-02]|uniref:Uma2 family endonuclease n=1 Tax=Coleofasciculus sp. G2-EDA-02 TaxID=3069529 RepID=UPI0032F77E1A
MRVPTVSMSLSTSVPIIYPESDGQPLADNTIQFRLIVTIQGGIDALFIDNPNVFVAGDLFWYPVEGEPWIRQAPDVMVVMGRPKGDRRSYKQWEEENIPPQVVFEIVSKSNTRQELEGAKRRFYERYGVEEYYLFNPAKGILKGWRRDREVELLQPIPQMLGWVSPRLGIRFEVVEGELQLYRPDGERFVTYLESIEYRELERQRAEQERQRAEQEQQRAEQERQRAEQAEQAQREAIPKLLAMGLSVEQIAEALSLPVDTVRVVARIK